MKTTRILAAGIGAFLLGNTPAFAATWTWTGAGNNSWNISVNWNPVSLPANDGTADIIFGASPRLTPDLNLNWNVRSVTFNNSAGTYTLGSSNSSILTIGAGGLTANTAVANFPTINHAIVLGAAQTWNAVTSSLSISGAVNNAGHLLTIDGPTGVGLSGVISGGGGLTKNGVGQLTLGATTPNTYTGTTTVNGGLVLLVFANEIPGVLIIGDGVGTTIDTVLNFTSNQVADSASVSVLSTGYWDLSSQSAGISETITNLNFVSTGIAGGGLVKIGDSTLTLLGDMTMTGGAMAASGVGVLSLNGNLTTNAATVAASISSGLGLGNGTRTFTIGDGAVPNDLDVTGVVSNGGIVKDGPGALRLAVANTYAGGTTLNAGTILIGHDSALGTGPLTGNGGTLRADGAARTIANALNGSFAVDGAFDLTLNNPSNVAGNITKNGSGTLIFAQTGAIFEGLTVNAGAARFDAAVTFSNGLTNLATLLPGTQTLTVDGAGFNNQSPLLLAGATLAGSGPVVNDSLIMGYGTIGGSGGFTNNAQFTVSGGSLTLANAGANANAGIIAVPAGLQLRLTGGTLANTGAVELAGSIVAGTGLLSNNTGGTVSGRGLISAPFDNAGGTLRAIGGTLNVTNAFTNGGVIRLDDGAGLAGGAITNAGRIQGDGSISNALANGSTGSIRVDAGDTLFFTGAFAANDGQLNLQGGTLDFPGSIASSATGYITGRGALFTGGLTNGGQMAFSGGTADIFGDVSLTAGSRVATSGAGSVTTFWDDVTHDGTEVFTGVNCSTVFFGGQSGAGSFTGGGTLYFIGDLRPGSSPATISFAPQVVIAPSNILTLELGGLIPGTQHDKLLFTHASTPQVQWGGTLAVQFINGFTPTANDSFDVLDFDAARDAGGFDILMLPSLPAGLRWDTTELYTTGTLRVLPQDLTYGDWAATALGDANASPVGDHDHDGTPNLIEFALGLFPPQAGTVPPAVDVHPYPDGERLRILFTRPLDRSGVTLRVQASGDLVHWDELAVSVDSGAFSGPGLVSEDRSPPPGEPGLVEVRDILNAGAGARRFARVQAMLPP